MANKVKDEHFKLCFALLNCKLKFGPVPSGLEDGRIGTPCLQQHAVLTGGKHPVMKWQHLQLCQQQQIQLCPTKSD